MDTALGIIVMIPFFGVIALWISALVFDRINDKSKDGVR
jgi:hypothetical protein